MKFIKWTWKWEPKKIARKRTFWEWVCRKPPELFDSNQLYYVKKAVEFDNLIKLLEEVASTQTKGHSCHCMAVYNDGYGTSFFVDKGRNKLAIQCSAFGSKEAKSKMKALKNNLETDNNGMLFDIADKNGKTYEIVFNVVDKLAHMDYNRKKNTGG